jgi:toxin ParE1/3/4
MIRLEWSDPAVADLDNIHDHLARDSTEYADAVIEQLIVSVERLKSFPESGRLVPEATGIKHVRELIVSPYRIIYRLRKQAVQILVIVHAPREPGTIKPEPSDAA